MLELGLRSLNVSVGCQFCALLSHVLTAYYLVTFEDNCFITRFHFDYFFSFIFLNVERKRTYGYELRVTLHHCNWILLYSQKVQ